MKVFNVIYSKNVNNFNMDVDEPSPRGWQAQKKLCDP